MPTSLLLFLLSSLISIINFSRASGQCMDDQKTLVLELKNELIFNPSVSIKLVQWNQTDDCCSWDGVECDGAGHVISLQLDHEAISGGIDNSSSLFSLNYLQKLNLAHNSLNGGIPGYLFRLPSLQQLKLSNNNFSGYVILPTLNFSNMEELDLSSNRLKGHIPMSLFKLEKLRVLSLSNNLFSGTFEVGNIQMLRNLTTLDLSYNNLSVDATNTNLISSGFSQLKKLCLASCNLLKFPDFIKQFDLEFLELSNNNIKGEIPSWIWEIGNGTLFHLNLSSNQLVDLQKPYNIPPLLDELDLHSNQLLGDLPLPPREGSYVDFSLNNFDKSIPPDFVNPNSFLTFLSLANNRISGSIPNSVCNAIFLQVLDLSLNNLSGNIPPCLLESIHNLKVFNLRRNNISGDIPDKFSIDCGLKTLDLSANNLGGNIPKSLANCKSLEYMNVGHNNINDSFPCMLPSSLRFLVLHSNRFHGEVRCHVSWPNLQIIDISLNNFSGNLQKISFSSWREMMLVSDEQLSWQRTKRSNVVVRPDLFYPLWNLNLYKLIDFSSNNFEGELPDAIGDLMSLIYINLSHNALTGTIPKSLGNTLQLEALDLSVNKLTGVIPMELTGLEFLSFFNLSYNKLGGEIPWGHQFSTFDNYSYEGNTGLCGAPLTKSCSYSTDENDLSPARLRNIHSNGKMGLKWDSVSAAVFVGLGCNLWLLF